MKTDMEKKSSQTNMPIDSMQKFVRRVYQMFFISAIIVILLVYFLVYQPMKNELEKSLINNFAQVSHSNYHSFENSIQRGIEGAKSLSSRTMIKSSIIDYYNKAISLEYLKVYTQPKYEDGAKALEYLVSATRIVDGSVIAQFNDSDGIAMPDPAMAFEKDMRTKISISNGQTQMVIFSPIVNGNTVIGRDLLIFDLDKQIDILCTDIINISILDKKEYEKLLEAALIQGVQNEITILKDSTTIYAASPIKDDKYLISMQEQSLLFEPVNQLALRIIIGGLVTFAGYTILAYLYIIRHTKKELSSLEFSRDEYKNIAHKDYLTGVYNRQFLDVWNQTARSFHADYAIVMIDVDDFKDINDFYGHHAGDTVLQTIGTVIVNSIRISDLPVRYGGDEFVLILSNATAETARFLMERIEAQMNAATTNLPPIRLSYGVSILNGRNDFEDTLKQADQDMYECKNKKKPAQAGPVNFSAIKPEP